MGVSTSRKGKTGSFGKHGPFCGDSNPNRISIRIQQSRTTVLDLIMPLDQTSMLFQCIQQEAAKILSEDQTNQRIRHEKFKKEGDLPSSFSNPGPITKQNSDSGLLYRRARFANGTKNWYFKTTGKH